MEGRGVTGGQNAHPPGHSKGVLQFERIIA